MNSETAVSPVVGVMLMLVVTIIIAAVVAVFASGVVTTTETAPQLTFKATYSQSQGMTISHTGGDAVSLTDTNFMTTPSELMGPDAAKFAYIIDKSIIINSADNEDLAASSSKAFKSGDMFYVTAANCKDYSTEKDWTGPSPGVNENAQVFWTGDGKSAYFGAYAFCNPANLGTYFYLDLVDKAGSVIARTKVTITS
ncbi:MAG TPA: type IV pilin N-terminal domain-containing protein [Methanocorpusculum sp.]|nr:type IV pilin N-terminal domain-containing protein [Methanocorpusculum sp.]